jgi:hypothetical protein
MTTLCKTLAVICVCTGLAFAFFATSAQPAATPDVSATVLVTALDPGFLPASIAQGNVSVSSGKTSLNVSSWARAKGDSANLQLAILIDNNVKELLAGQPTRDLANFVLSQPSSVSIGLYFADKGKATQALAFTTDHQAVANSLSQPTPTGESLRVYPSLPDLAAHWPSPAAPRREILMIGSGYDALVGGMEDPNINAGNDVYTGTNYDHNVTGERDPYLNAMLQNVLRAGIVVHAIYVPDPRFAQMVQANIMRDKLIEFSNQTGGLAFFNDNSMDAFASYLREFNNALLSQYLLTVSENASRKGKGELRPLHVDAGQSRASLYVPQQIFVP